jgi:hypothetical protein
MLDARAAAVGSPNRALGVYAVDLIADRAKQFYRKYGFVEMLDSPLHLFLPIQTARGGENRGSGRRRNQNDSRPLLLSDRSLLRSILQHHLTNA